MSCSLVILSLVALGPGAFAAPPGMQVDSSGDANKDVENLRKILEPKQAFKASEIDWTVKNRIDKCLQDETQFVEIESNLIDSWRETWLKQNSNAFSQLTTKKFKQSGFAATSTLVDGGARGIRVMKWTDQHGVAGPTDAIKTYLGQWKKVEDVALTTVDYDVASSWRAAKNLDYSKADLKIRFDVRGQSYEGKRQNDRGVLTARVERQDAKSAWKISSLTVQNGESAILDREPAFVDRTQDSGLGKVPVEVRKEAIRRGGFAVAVADINGDGRPDLYVGGDSGGSLWYGDHPGHFARQTGHPLEKEAAVKTAIFADFRNSGRNDVFFTRFVYGENLTDLSYYKNEKNGEYKKVDSFVKGKYQYRFAMPATTADFDKDGYLDLYVGFPGQRDFTHLDREESDKRKYPQGLFLNSGVASNVPFFLDASDSWWTGWEHNMDLIANIFPHSALAIDYDRDGNSDLLVVDDRMNISPVYHNVDGKRFEAAQNDLQINNRGFGMGVAAADFDNDGQTDIVITNVNSAAASRIQNSCSKHWHLEHTAGDKDGLRLFKGAKDGKFLDVTRVAGLEWAGEGLAGVEFIDYDNDGLPDIYVANGLWSGSKRKSSQNLSSLFSRAILARKALPNQIEDTNDYKNLAFLNVLRNFVGDLREKGTEHVRPSMAGWQRNRLFHNDGNGHFTEVGYLEGVDSIADGYVIAKGDLNGDGRMDLVLRNGDPGTKEYQFPAIQYFENNFPNKNSLILTLQGTKSNRNGIGALLEVETSGIDGKKQFGQLTANNGSAQSELMVHFGLGEASAADKVTMRWPSGQVQTFKNLKSGRYTIEEGGKPVPVLAIDIASSTAKN